MPSLDTLSAARLDPATLRTNPGPDAAPALRNARFASNPSLAAVARGGGLLGPGAGGESVSVIQAALLDMGFALRPYTATSGRLVGGIDGAYGGQTERAVANFQRHARHLFPAVRPTGTVDQATLQALDRLAPAPGRKAWEGDENPTAPRPVWNRSQTKVRVVVVKDEHRTFLYDRDGRVKGIFANSVGKARTPTDTGLKKVTGKLGLNDARATGSRLWGDPGAFGVRIIDLSWADGRRSGEELHGTFANSQLGMDVSHGCIRHHNDDILTIFGELRVGDMVAVVDRVNAPELGHPLGRF